jgi:biotin carboxylase
MNAAYEEAKAADRGQHVIAESCIAGRELSCEGVVVDGQFTLLALADKEVDNSGTTCVTWSLTYPSLLTDHWSELNQLLARAAHALGIHQGCCHAEVIWDGRTFQMLEMAARGGGGHIYTTIVGFVSGYDLVELSVRLACGWPVDCPRVSPAGQRAACYRFLPAPQGILCGISGVDQARRCPLIHEVGFSVAPGQRLGPVTDGATRPGWIVALGASRDEVVKAAERAAERIRFETTPPVNSELLGAECRPSMG